MFFILFWLLCTFLAIKDYHPRPLRGWRWNLHQIIRNINPFWDHKDTTSFCFMLALFDLFILLLLKIGGI